MRGFDTWVFIRDLLNRGATIEQTAEARGLGYEQVSAKLDAVARETADMLNLYLARTDPQRRLVNAMTEIGVGEFRGGWLAEADRIWAERETVEPDVWAVRCRELLRCILAAHKAAGTDPVNPRGNE